MGKGGRLSGRSRSCEGALAQNLTSLLANSQEVSGASPPAKLYSVCAHDALGLARVHGSGCVSKMRVRACVSVLIFEQLRSGRRRRAMTDSEVLGEPRGPERAKEKKKGKRNIGTCCISTTEKKTTAAAAGEALKIYRTHVDATVM